MDGQNNGQTDRIMGGQTNKWMDMQYMCMDMQKTMIFQQIFTKALRTDRRTNGPTDQWTDIPSYRDAWTHLKTEQINREIQTEP